MTMISTEAILSKMREDVAYQPSALAMIFGVGVSAIHYMLKEMALVGSVKAVSQNGVMVYKIRVDDAPRKSETSPYKQPGMDEVRARLAKERVIGSKGGD